MSTNARRGTIRVAWGTGSGPTEMAAYDAALAGAGVENYNLVAVSSVIPADSRVEAVGTAPDLGPAGDRLTVVEARSTVAGPGRANAALGWIRADDGPGLFYEEHEATDRPGSGDRGNSESDPDAGDVEHATPVELEAVEQASPSEREDVDARVLEGLAAGADLRDWSVGAPRVRVARADADAGTYATAVVLGIYGEADPIL